MCLFGCLQGVPRVPKFREVTSGPGAGEIIIQTKTAASGVNNPAQGFKFIIMPVLDDNTLDPI